METPASAEIYVMDALSGPRVPNANFCRFQQCGYALLRPFWFRDSAQWPNFLPDQAHIPVSLKLEFSLSSAYDCDPIPPSQGLQCMLRYLTYLLELLAK